MEYRIVQKKSSQIINLLQVYIDKKSYDSGKILHGCILRNGLFSDTFISNRLIEFYSKCGRVHEARNVFDKIPERNVFSWNAVISACCKDGYLTDAYKFFIKMPERNVVSWNTLISTLTKNGHESKALNMYEMMITEGFIPTHFTFASVLSACGCLSEITLGKRCHNLAIKVGLNSNMYVENALVGMYSKCGCVQDALMLFDDMPQPNEVSCTAMIGGLALSDSVLEALSLFRMMHRTSMKIDPVAVSSILGVCSRLSENSDQNYSPQATINGQQVHAFVIKMGFECISHVGNTLIDMYAKCGYMDDAEMMFKSLPAINVVSWNVLISGYGKQGHGAKAIELFDELLQLGYVPDEVTYISMLGACVKSSNIEIARAMFDKIPSPGLSSWNAIISGYSQTGKDKEAIELFRIMQDAKVEPDRTTVAVILSSCAGRSLIKYGKEVHASSVKASFINDVFVSSGLVDMYSKCGNLNYARKVFDRMSERDVVCWNSMITALSLHSLNNEAFFFFVQMREEGIYPTQFSYASVLSSCARISSLSEGRQIHTLIIKDGHINDVFVGTSLIDMYAKCGKVEDARLMFDKMPDKNIISWNEMLHGYAQNGYGNEAVELFEELIKKKEKPDAITFVAVLTACSHAGLVDSGIKIFNSMESNHNIEPLADHYTCMIDSLGRAGRFNEAKVLINKMPCKDDPILWEVLLSSCRVHANVELGKYAAEQLFRLEPQNSTPFVLLANMYASLGNWNDASSIRKLMSERGLVKDPAYTWGEFKHGNSAYNIEDKLMGLDDNMFSGSLIAQNVARDLSSGA